jgi:CDP-glycerol glycerophosphotransferase (TagB/SpsB family)
LHRRLARCDAIVAAERTSAWLRKLGHSKTLMIHFRHGAGDRAPASEARLQAFDLVVVPGEKDVRRAVAQGFPAERLRVCGYVKLDYCGTEGASGVRFANDRPGGRLANDRPIVLYNPHFDPALSSLGVAEAVVAKFAAQNRYNLIVAPHIRASGKMSKAERARWRAMAVPGTIVVDLDSPALVDMSYTRAADVYLGDVSSQVYEFWVRPRPAAFLNAHRVAWQGDLRYAGWALGEVADDLDQVLPAIDRAIAEHATVRDAQRDAVAHAFGQIAGAARRGAAIVAEAVADRA